MEWIAQGTKKKNSYGTRLHERKSAINHGSIGGGEDQDAVVLDNKHPI